MCEISSASNLMTVTITGMSEPDVTVTRGEFLDALQLHPILWDPDLPRDPLRNYSCFYKREWEAVVTQLCDCDRKQKFPCASEMESAVLQLQAYWDKLCARFDELALRDTEEADDIRNALRFLVGLKKFYPPEFQWQSLVTSDYPEKTFKSGPKEIKRRRARDIAIQAQKDLADRMDAAAAKKRKQEARDLADPPCSSGKATARRRTNLSEDAARIVAEEMAAPDEELRHKVMNKAVRAAKKATPNTMTPEQREYRNNKYCIAYAKRQEKLGRTVRPRRRRTHVVKEKFEEVYVQNVRTPEVAVRNASEPPPLSWVPPPESFFSYQTSTAIRDHIDAMMQQETAKTNPAGIITAPRSDASQPLQQQQQQPKPSVFLTMPGLKPLTSTPAAPPLQQQTAKTNPAGIITAPRSDASQPLQQQQQQPKPSVFLTMPGLKPLTSTPAAPPLQQQTAKTNPAGIFMAPRSDASPPLQQQQQQTNPAVFSKMPGLNRVFLRPHDASPLLQQQQQQQPNPAVFLTMPGLKPCTSPLQQQQQQTAQTYPAGNFTQLGVQQQSSAPSRFDASPPLQQQQPKPYFFATPSSDASPQAAPQQPTTEKPPPLKQTVGFIHVHDAAQPCSAEQGAWALLWRQHAALFEAGQERRRQEELRREIQQRADEAAIAEMHRAQLLRLRMDADAERHNFNRIEDQRQARQQEDLLRHILELQNKRKTIIS